MSGSRLVIIVLVASTAALWPAGARATTVVPLTPEQVDARADRVLVGTVVARRACLVDGTRIPCLEYEVRVERALHGDAVERALREERPLRFRTYGGTLPDGRSLVPGLPVFEVGERLRLALHPDSRLGLTSPVGMSQGVRRLPAPRETTR